MHDWVASVGVVYKKSRFVALVDREKQVRAQICQLFTDFDMQSYAIHDPPGLVNLEVNVSPFYVDNNRQLPQGKNILHV